MTPAPLRLGWRRRTARQLRVLASWLEDRRVVPHHSGIPHRLRGRTDLQALADEAVQPRQLRQVTGVTPLTFRGHGASQGDADL